MGFDRQFLLQLFQPLAPSAGQDKFAALFGKQPGTCFPESGRGPGDENCLVHSLPQLLSLFTVLNPLHTILFIRDI
jgi:hypothetical protein